MIELTQTEYVKINQAFDAACRAAQSPMLVAQELIPIAVKLKGMVAQPVPTPRSRKLKVVPKSNGAEAPSTAAQPA